MQVSSYHIRGLIPDTLVDTHCFWRTAGGTLYGYPHAGGNSIIVVSMLPVPGEAKGIVHRLKARKDENSLKPIPCRPMTLLNLLEAPSPKPCGELELLRRLSRLFISLDNPSHILIWSSTLPEVRNLSGECSHQNVHSQRAAYVQTAGDQCDVTLIELPRLRLRFEPRKCRDGKIRIYSCNYGDLFISDKQNSVHAVGMPRVLVLEDMRGRLRLLVPNWKLSQPKMLTCPLSSVVVTSVRVDRDSKRNPNRETRHFIYPVHVSGTFLIRKSLAASLYLVRAFCARCNSCACQFCRLLI